MNLLQDDHTAVKISVGNLEFAMLDSHAASAPQTTLASGLACDP